VIDGFGDPGAAGVDDAEAPDPHHPADDAPASEGRVALAARRAGRDRAHLHRLLCKHGLPR
jgi:hypothetical protein